jgi:putative DNA primase/helicase
MAGACVSSGNFQLAQTGHAVLALLAKISGCSMATLPPLTPRAPEITTAPEHQLREAIASAGITPPERIVMDGRVHRFPTNGKRGDDSGWYIAFNDGVPAGRYGCHRSGIDQAWRANIGRPVSFMEQAALDRQMQAAREAREADKAARAQAVGMAVADIWNGAQDCETHPYLTRKGVRSHGLKVTDDGRLIVPLLDHDGVVSNLQYIAADGDKKFHLSGGVTGLFGYIQGSDQIVICEGYATGATVHEVTGATVFLATSANQLLSTAQFVRSQFPNTVITLCADYDKLKFDANGNPIKRGHEYAKEAADAIAGAYVCPPEIGDVNDYAAAGGDVAALFAAPVKEPWLVSVDDFAGQPKPIRWLVKGWLQREALHMVFGPSGGGKTFVVLDMCMTLASGMPDWCGHTTKTANVVYLAGEGHHGLAARMAAWMQRHNARGLNMWISRTGTDLDTPAGLEQVVENVRQLPVQPDLIVVDTLHRFLSGDENSAQDASRMLKACDELKQRFGAAVLLVHHTGVSEEAQARERGSSAWRGAMDVSIGVTPSKDATPMKVWHRKVKDGKEQPPIFGQLSDVEIDGWIDEDGEQVTSCVFERIEHEAVEKREPETARHLKLLRNCWEGGGREMMDGKPFIARAVAIRYLMQHDGLTERQAMAQLKPDGRGAVAYLLTAQTIMAQGHGWTLEDVAAAGVWQMVG